MSRSGFKVRFLSGGGGIVYCYFDDGSIHTRIVGDGDELKKIERLILISGLDVKYERLYVSKFVIFRIFNMKEFDKFISIVCLIYNFNMVDVQYDRVVVEEFFNGRC